MSGGWRTQADGIVLSVRVTPRASRDTVAAGPDGAVLAVRVTAPPVDGAANAAVAALIARSFGVAKRDVAIVGGETARVKRVTVAGDPARLAETAKRLYGSEA